MKKYLFITIFCLTATLFVGCEEDLNVTNPATLSLEQFITDGATAEIALLNAYDDMQREYVAGAYPKMFSGLYADNLNHTGSFPTFTEIWTDNILTNNVNLERFYRDHYFVINTTTEVIIVTEGLSDDAISAEAKSSILAEAHALRAYAYFELVKVFGGLPIPETTVPLSGDGANNVPRSSESEVYAYINNEISLAEGNITNTSNTRFTNNALQVLKAKVQLYQGDYAGVEATLQPLIGQYSLATDYATLWEVGADTNETIFRINYNTADNNSLAFFFYPAPQGRREVAPSQELLDDFEANDVRKNMIVNNTDANAAYLNKYSDTGNGADKPYIYRYADVLLMYAEVLARRDDASASDYINQVRTRAGLGNVTINSSNVVDLIANERRFELYGEGDRWNDIKRLGIAQQVIEGKVVGSWADYKLLWPIPQDEIDTNDAISQADQNPGY